MAAFIKYYIYVPCEWVVDVDYEHLIHILFEEIDSYIDIHPILDEFVSTKNNVTACLIIDNTRKIYWFKRVRIDDDRRPHTVNYYPRLAPIHLEEQWQFIPHNNNNNNNNNNNDDDYDNSDNNNNDDDDTDEVSTDDDNAADNDAEMQEFFLQNWIAADGNESGYISYEEDDDDVNNI
ncbi:hypothetical protein PV325_008126 [Microctonus aethiopoides]|nr:hypothetical protein PV325_008126 [Microctonus aethiopoides]